jgi:glycine cleavage system regulatory protein
VLVEGDADRLRAAVSAVDAAGLDVRIAPAGAAPAAAGETLAFSVVGQDRPGIVRQVTATISDLGANIESFRTWLSTEAHSGAPLFHIAANLRLPAGLSAAKVQDALEAISGEIMVDVAVG